MKMYIVIKSKKEGVTISSVRVENINLRKDNSIEIELFRHKLEHYIEEKKGQGRTNNRSSNNKEANEYFTEWLNEHNVPLPTLLLTLNAKEIDIDNLFGVNDTVRYKLNELTMVTKDVKYINLDEKYTGMFIRISKK